MVDFHERETQSGHGSLDEAEQNRLEEDNADEVGTGEEDDHSHHGTAEESAHHHAHDVDTLRVGVVTVSSTRSLEDDPSGDAIVAAFEAADHEISIRELVREDYDGIQSRIEAIIGRDDIDVVVMTGGTGVTPDDVTVEALQPLFDKRLPGFGELFRRRSEADIGTRVVATRAVAGIADGVPVFCLPGSEAAAQLGATQIIVPEAGHLTGLAGRDEEEE
jgi:molybdenum cofactor biosynthesis protein B